MARSIHASESAPQCPPSGDFYSDTLRKLLRSGEIDLTMRVLVVCGGDRDRDALHQCGFRHVTISNLDVRMRGDEFAPFQWSYQDAEHLTFADDQFDLCIAHSGLHHCRSPHRALIEMYRVAKVGVLVFEPYDGPFARLGVLLNIAQEYEVAAVFDNDLAFGGLQNTEVPNYVYRWTEIEVRKSIQSYAPFGRHRFSFFYATRVPWSRFRLLKNKVYLGLALTSIALVRLVGLVFPRVCNNFAFFVLKPRMPDDLFPWLTLADADKSVRGNITVNKDWFTRRYRKQQAKVPAPD
jgi:SAM-dependent methyltransferase